MGVDRYMTELLLQADQEALTDKEFSRFMRPERIFRQSTQ
jgi:hypothetical protein